MRLKWRTTIWYADDGFDKKFAIVALIKGYQLQCRHDGSDTLLFQHGFGKLAEAKIAAQKWLEACEAKEEMEKAQ